MNVNVIKDDMPIHCPPYPPGQCGYDDPQFKPGMCDTSGIYEHVLPFMNHQQIIPGKIYYGLDFTDRSYSGVIYHRHKPPKKWTC